MKSETEYLRKVGQRIREVRLKKGWTLEDIEEKGFQSWRHLQKIEGGKNFTMITLQRICKAFGMSSSELLKGIM